MKKYILALLIISAVSSCADKGLFYAPAMLEMETPEGPMEFKAGWHDGCQSGMSMKYFQGGWVYDLNAGNGVYQHDTVYQSAWANAFQSCRVSNMNFPKHTSWKDNTGNGKWGALRN